MQLLVTYDIKTDTREGRRRLRQSAKVCLDYGQRVQYSVFECKVDMAQFVQFKAKLLAIIDPESDSIRFYNLGTQWDQRVEHYGVKPSMNPEAPMIL